MERPRIGFLTAEDARTRTAWSGIPYYMARALEEHCGQVRYLGPIFSPVEFLARVRSKASKVVRGRGVPYHHSTRVAKSHARAFRRRLRRERVDVIFAPAASTQLAYLETDVPIVYTSDATFDLMRNYYGAFTGLPEPYVAGGNEIERRALQRADLVLYPSAWAAESALRAYGIPQEKVHILPYGANLDAVPEPDAIAGAKRADRCEVLFLGVDWERKGGPIALEAVRELRRGGTDAGLVVCGCSPPGPTPDWVTVVPRLDKNVPAEQARLSNLLLRANFLLLPTRSECYGVVFCEAAAHGTPSVATATGGVAGALVEGESGFLLPSDAGPAAYAERIADAFGDQERYLALVASSRRVYDRELNWGRWGLRAGELIRSLLGRTAVAGP